MAVVTDVRDWVTGNSGMQLITCVASDHETFATKFKTIYCVMANSRSRAGGYVAVATTGIITIHLTAASDDTFDILIFGN